MEPPFKKRRVTGNSPQEMDLHARRAQNDFRLKSIFESIFDKYGRDFDGIGDEIDMKTGEIVVDNGHILGMANERDVGDAENSSEELSHSDDEDDHSSSEYSEENSAGLELFNAGGAAVMEEPESSEQSAFDADSLMGDVPADSHLHELGKKSRKAISIPTDDEEDELASSDIEWASHNKDKMAVQERLCLINDIYSFKDQPAIEPAIEPAWRAPPLPNKALFKRGTDVLGPNSVDNMREYSDDERAGVSLWTHEIKKRPRRRHECANSPNQQSVLIARGQENNADGLLSDLSNIDPPTRRIVKWTQEEEELLIHLKTATNLSSAAMESYFPARQGSSIGSHWTYMVNQGKASPKPQMHTISGSTTTLPSLSPSIKSSALDENRPKPHDQYALSRAKESQPVHQQMDEGFPEAESLIRSASKHIKHSGDTHMKPPHMDPRYQAGGDHRTLSDSAMDESNLIYDNVGAHIRSTLGEPFSSVSDCETKGITVDESMDDASEPPARTSEHSHPTGKVHSSSGRRSVYRQRIRTRQTKRSNRPQAFVSRTFDVACHVDDDHHKAESADPAISNISYANTDQSYRLSKPPEIDDHVGGRGASSFPDDQGLGIVSKNGGGAWVSSPTPPIKAAPDLEGAESYSDGVVSPELQPRCATAIEAPIPPKQFRTSPSTLQREASIPPTREDDIQRKRLMKEETQKTGSTNKVSTNSEQTPEHGKSSAFHEPSLEVASNTFINRQIVQVVIPLTAVSNVTSKCGGTKQSPLSHPHVISPLATTETEDPALIRQSSATAESAPEALGSDLPQQEDLAIHTPTRSPSVAAAESQYAASAAIVKDVRSSLGPEIADSQPPSTTPVLTTPVRDLGGEATRPIVLDAESPPLRVTPGVALSVRKQPTKATKIIISGSDSQPLRVTLGIATPARKRIQEATESDIVESGSGDLSRTLSAARSPSKKVKKEMVAKSSSIWTAIDDHSEDELSYL